MFNYLKEEKKLISVKVRYGQMFFASYHNMGKRLYCFNGIRIYGSGRKCMIIRDVIASKNIIVSYKRFGEEFNFINTNISNVYISYFDKGNYDIINIKVLSELKKCEIDNYEFVEYFYAFSKRQLSNYIDNYIMYNIKVFVLEGQAKTCPFNIIGDKHEI